MKCPWCNGTGMEYAPWNESGKDLCIQCEGKKTVSFAEWWEVRPWWIDIGWYKYMFGPRTTRKGWGISWIGTVYCRMRNHPAGPIYYCSNCSEPDNRCKNCGEEI